MASLTGPRTRAGRPGRTRAPCLCPRPTSFGRARSAPYASAPPCSPAACAARRASAPFRRCIAVRPRNGRLATRTPAHRAHLPLPALARAPGAPCASPLRAPRASPVIPSRARHTAARPAGRARLRLPLYSGLAPRLHCGLPPHFASQPPCCPRPGPRCGLVPSPLRPARRRAVCHPPWSPAPPPKPLVAGPASYHGPAASLLRPQSPCAHARALRLFPVARPTKASVPLDRGTRPQNV
nr:atherin-like [Aegilops tauschii subsp. strangulata]